MDFHAKNISRHSRGCYVTVHWGWRLVQAWKLGDLDLVPDLLLDGPWVS